MLVAEEEVLPGVFYFRKTDHRDKTRKKSQWTITLPEDKACFLEGYDTGVFTKYNQDDMPAYNNCWGLHLVDDKVAYLGKTRASNPPVRQAFIAIFDDNTSGKWHGYPADPSREPSEMPPALIRTIWLNKGYFTSRQIKKLVQRKLWKL